MKVCVTGLRGVPAIMGGVESHCEELYPRLRRLMPEAQIEIIGRRPYAGAEPYDFAGLRVTPLSALPSKYFEALSNTLLAIFYARFKARADLVHIHAIGPGILAPLARLMGMKTVVTHHGKDYQRQKWNRFAKTTLEAGEWLAIKSADRVMVVSDSLTQELAGRFPENSDKLEYVPNGMPTPADFERGDDGATLARFGLECGNYVLAVGRLVPEKGFHDLVAAFELSGAAGKLVIVGAADHADSYSETLMSRASERIVFTGRQDHGALGAFYRNASLFVLPSYHEGLPIVVLEAARFGAPIVASDIPANRDIGLAAVNYFPVGDVMALRDKLAADHSGFGIDAEAISARFDWDQIAQRTAAVYRACAGVAGAVG